MDIEKVKKEKEALEEMLKGNEEIVWANKERKMKKIYRRTKGDSVKCPFCGKRIFFGVGDGSGRFAMNHPFHHNGGLIYSWRDLERNVYVWEFETREKQ
jgi:hypothetical protein